MHRLLLSLALLIAALAAACGGPSSSPGAADSVIPGATLQSESAVPGDSPAASQ